MHTEDMFITQDEVGELRVIGICAPPEQMGGDLIDRHFLEDLVRPTAQVIRRLTQTYPAAAEELSRRPEWVDMVLALYRAEERLAK